jgi:hypothetical protein
MSKSKSWKNPKPGMAFKHRNGMRRFEQADGLELSFYVFYIGPDLADKNKFVGCTNEDCFTEQLGIWSKKGLIRVPEYDLEVK